MTDSDGRSTSHSGHSTGDPNGSASRRNPLAVATLAVGSVTLVLSVVLAGIYTVRAAEDDNHASTSDTTNEHPDIEISILRTTDDSLTRGSGTVESGDDESNPGADGGDGSNSRDPGANGSGTNEPGTKNPSTDEPGADDSNANASPDDSSANASPDDSSADGSGESAEANNRSSTGIPTGQSTPGPDATGQNTPRPSTTGRPTTNDSSSGHPTTNSRPSDRSRPGQDSPRQPATNSPTTRPSTTSPSNDGPSPDQPSTGRTDPAPTAPNASPPSTNTGGGASTPSTAPNAPSAPNPPVAAPAPVSDLGSHQNPAMLGTTIEMSLAGTVMYEVTLGSSDLNADDVIAAANPSTEPPPPGFHYAIVPMTVTYRGPEKGTPWVDISVEFVSSAGSVHKISDTHAVPPAPTVMDMPVLSPNETALGNVLVIVPSNDGETWFDTRSAGGVWAVSTPFSTSTFYFAAR